MTDVLVAVALVLLAVAVWRMTMALRSLEETLETLRQEPQPEPPKALPPAPRNSHPVIKVMAFGTGASRAARHMAR